MARNAMAMLLAVTVVVGISPGETEASRFKAQVKAKVKAKIEKRGGLPGAKLAVAARARLKQMGATRAERRAHQRGRALADVHKTGRTRVRTVGDVLFHPVLHGAVAFGGMLLLGMTPGMSLIAGGIVYFSSRSAKKTSDDWLKLENSSIDVLERDGPEASQQRFRYQGAKDPAKNLSKLQRNRHLRNQHYDD